MIDIFMLIMMIILAVVLLVISLYLLVYYCHPDDAGFGSGLVCKIFAILGLSVCWAQVLLLPLDVSNTRGSGGGIRMDVIWQIVYIVIACFVFVIIPLLTSFYECDPDWTCCEKITNGFCFFFTEIIVVGLLFGIGFALLNKAEIPIVAMNCPLTGAEDSASEINAHLECTVEEDSKLEITVGFPIFAIGLLSFISYFLFVVYGGIGIFALPLDMIYSFCSRPIKISGPKLESMKKEVVETAADLKELAVQIQQMEKEGVHKKSIFSSEKRHYNTLLKQLKVGVAVIDDEYQLINIQNMLDRKSVLGYYCNMIFGVIFMIVSLIWVAHFLLYVIITPNGKPVTRGINILLVYLTEHNVSFVAIGIFAFLCIYLLLATIKGNFKFGVRVLILGSIHPMKKNETYMNSILFNIMLVMITSVSVNQFCVKAFNEYAAMTDLDLIFSAQIQYLQFFVYFYKYNIFEYILCGVMILSFVYLILRLSDSNSMKKLLYAQQAKENKAKESSKEKLIEMRDTTVKDPTE